MANQKEIETMYDWVDKFHALRIGEYPDFTCAYYNGDYSKTLKQAQTDKHNWILKGIKFKKGDRILDIGCGWGPMLNAVRNKGGKAVGLTLSSAQKKYCTDRKLDIRLKDWKAAKAEKFNGVVSIGAFEHFCSIDEYKKGLQEQIYKDFFKFCSDSLPKGGRLFLQTMVWGKKVPNPYSLNLNAPEGTTKKILARVEKFYPGSFLPESKEQIINCAKPYFKFIESNNGRLDYIETLKGWSKSNKNLFKPRNVFSTLKAIISLIPRYLTDRDFRIQIELVRKSDQRNCFIREIMTHERMFFEKK
ncbi:class I SAM-dependent methyltransferase [Candidatus Pacearchaeota archaeon]|nr:class I SAM-dependent methyltransferase [Candidatus Pacearchaeota archaeon]